MAFDINDNKPQTANTFPSRGSSVRIILSLALIRVYDRRWCSRALSLALHVMIVVHANET